MTREEAKDILQEVVNWKYDSLRGHPSINSIAEAVEIVLQNNLPSNINEAAEEWFHYVKYKSDLSCAPINAFKAGAEWMMNNLWHSADGDYLPEIDREVVVFTQEKGLSPKVCISHRPNPKGWDGTSISTGKTEHFQPMLYGKGGWSLPDVKWWLNADFPFKEGGEV